MKTLKPAKTVPELLEQIREAVKKGNYIFRGESKENDEVCSGLYRRFSGVHKGLVKRKEFQMGSLQKNMLEEVKQHITEDDNNLILEQLQHYGGKTNQIDFTTDYLVALFFACESNYKESGRIIIMNRDKLEKEKIVYEPKHPQNRVIAQKSVFIRPPSGVVEPDDIISILGGLKEDVLSYLRKYHGIRAENIYNDIHGFIKRSKYFEETYENFHIGLIYSEAGEYKKAKSYYVEALKYDRFRSVIYINLGVACRNLDDLQSAFNHHRRAIELNPNYFLTYYNLGIDYYQKGNETNKRLYYDRAIINFIKATELNTKDAQAYIWLGIVYDKIGDSKKCIDNLDKAEKLDCPNKSLLYINRGIMSKRLGRHREARKEFDAALRCARKENDKDTINYVLKKIEDIPPDGDS